MSGVQNIFSQIFLLNTADTAANAQLLLRDDAGNALTLELDGEQVVGQKDLLIPAGGLRILRTSGTGPLQVGSVTVSSDRALAGVILFGGSAGVAGVGSSAAAPRGFEATLDSNATDQINTGIAVVNTIDESVSLDLKLYDAAGQLLASAALEGDSALAAHGHLAIFVNQINWTEEPGVQLDFSNFRGLLKVRASGRVAATVLQTRPGVFATQPVVPSLF